jgi:hypothetical protein
MYVLRNTEARSRIIVAVEKQQGLRINICLCMRACSLAYAACDAYTPYCDVGLLCQEVSINTFF